MKRILLHAFVLGLLATASGCGGDDKPSKSNCEKACQRAEDAQCPNDDPLSVCVSDCNTALAAPTCQAEGRTFIACVASSGTFVCDMDGTATLTTCVTEGFAYFDCMTP